MRSLKVALLLSGVSAFANAHAAFAAGWTYQVLASSEQGNAQQIARFDSGLDAPALNDTGEVAFPAFDIEGNGVVFLSRHGAPAKQSATVAATDFTANTSINNQGQISYADGGAVPQVVKVLASGRSVRLPPATNTNAPASVLTDKGGVIVGTGDTLVLYRGITPKLTNKGYCTTSAPLSGNSAGQVAYTDCNFSYPSIYVTDTASASTKMLASSGTQALGQVGSPVINSAGIVAFSATAVAGQTGNISAIYTSSLSSTPTPLIYANNGACSYSAGPPAGSDSCTVTNYYPAAINTNNVLITEVTTVISGKPPSMATETNQTLALASQSVTTPVLASGTTVDGCLVTGISVGPEGLNASGQIAALLSCADYSARVVLISPSP